MISRNNGTFFRKICRTLHRDLSFFFAGMVIIYALSGIFMNHRRDLDPSYVINRSTFHIPAGDIPDRASMDREFILEVLKPLDEAQNFTQFYYPSANQLKVFLKGGSSLVIDTQSGEAVYESVKSRPLISQMVKLHFNPGSWWTWFADAFSVCLILITLTGMFMIKGPKGLWGRGGIELVIGILIPISFLLL